MLVLVLSADAAPRLPQPLTALLLTTGTLGRVEYRDASEFAMRRVADDRPFDWQPVPASLLPPPEVVPGQGNWVLAESASTRGLGRTDLAPGISYSLRVVTNGRVISGTVTIPGRPAPALVQASGRSLVWPRVAGAAEYVVTSETEQRRESVTRDTVFPLREDADPFGRPPNPRASVTAIDPNLSAFRRDSTRVRAGLSDGFGVFGAMTTTEIAIPPR